MSTILVTGASGFIGSRLCERLVADGHEVHGVWIDDVIDGLTRAAFAPHLGEISFDLGSGSQVSIRGVVEQIADTLGNHVKPIFGALPDRPFDRDRVADTTFMECTFHWKPSVSLRQGLVRTVDWYKRTRNLAAYVASAAFWAIASYVPDLLDYQDAWFAA